MCQNCVEVPQQLLELVPNRQTSLQPTKMVNEVESLRREIRACEGIIIKYQENEEAMKRTIEEQNAAFSDLKKATANQPSFSHA